jgi:hypothetical protein
MMRGAVKTNYDKNICSITLFLLYFMLINFENIFEYNNLKITKLMSRNPKTRILYILLPTKSYEIPKSPNHLYCL